MVIIAWLILAALIGYWASTRGRSGVGAFFISVVFSPVIGAIVVALVPPKRDAIEERQLQSGESKRCTKCAELIRPEAVKCRYCGSDLAAT